jgi:hypothetical protein
MIPYRNHVHTSNYENGLIRQYLPLQFESVTNDTGQFRLQENVLHCALLS